MTTAREDASSAIVRVIDSKTYVLIGNKSDQASQRKISREEINRVAKKLQIDDSMIFEISAVNDNHADLKKIVNAGVGYYNQLHPQPVLAKNAPTINPIKKHKNKLLLVLTAIFIAATIILIAALCWPSIVALPFMIAAGVGIAGLNIGLTATAATATLAGVIISAIGAGIVAAGTWLANIFISSNKKSTATPQTTINQNSGNTSKINTALGSNSKLFPTVQPTPATAISSGSTNPVKISRQETKGVFSVRSHNTLGASH